MTSWRYYLLLSFAVVFSVYDLRQHWQQREKARLECEKVTVRNHRHIRWVQAQARLKRPGYTELSGQMPQLPSEPLPAWTPDETSLWRVVLWAPGYTNLQQFWKGGQFNHGAEFNALGRMFRGTFVDEYRDVFVAQDKLGIYAVGMAVRE